MATPSEIDLAYERALAAEETAARPDPGTTARHPTLRKGKWGWYLADQGRRLFLGAYRSFEVSIPGDFPDLQTAVDRLSMRSFRQGAVVTLTIESGHEPGEGLLVEHGDYSMFRIESEDSVVTVDSGFSGDVVRGTFARMPVLACLIDMDDRGNDGYYAYHNSQGRVDENCGVRNAGDRGLVADRGSTVQADKSDFTGADNRGMHATNSSLIAAAGSDVSGQKHADGSGLYASRGSTIHFTGDASDCGGDGIVARRSRISCPPENSIDVSNAGGTGIWASGVSQITAGEAVVDGCGRGVNALHGSVVDVIEATITNSGNRGINASQGAVVVAVDATVTGSGNDDLVVVRGSQIVAINCETTNGTGGPDVGDTNVSSFNSIDANRGIIWGG